MQEEQNKLLVMNVLLSAIELDLLNNAFWHTRWSTAKNQKTAILFAERVDNASQKLLSRANELVDFLENREVNAFKSDCWRVV